MLVGIGLNGVHEGVEIEVRPGSKRLGHAAGQVGQRFFLGLGAGPLEPFQPGRAQVDGKAQWPFHNHLPVAEGLVGEDLGFLGFNWIDHQIADGADVFLGELAVLLAEVAPQRHVPFGGVDELDLAPALFIFAVGEHPDVGGDAGVVEHVLRQGDDGLQPVVLDDPAADIALALTGVAGEERRAVVDLGDAAAEAGGVLHLGELVDQEHELTVRGAGDHLVFRVAAVLGDKARVLDVALAAQTLQIGLPAFAIGRIGEHEVELLRREGIAGERGTILDVVDFSPFALQQQVGLGNGIGLGLNLLAVKVDLHSFLIMLCQFRQAFLGHGQHAAGAAGPVVNKVGARFDIVGHRQEDQVGHELDHIAGREVLSGLFVVLLVEAADQLLEDGAHGVVVERRKDLVAVHVLHRFGAEVDAAVEKLLDQVAEDVGLDQRGDLVAEFELVEDLLDVG